MKKIFLSLLLFSFYPVYGQQAQGQTTQLKWVIGFNFSPDYSSRVLRNTGGNTSGVIKSRNDMEVGKPGYTTGITVSRSFTGLLSFETGIQYSNKGYQTKKHDLFYSQPDPALPEKAKFIYNFRYIDIPFKVNFAFGKSRVKFIAGAGLITNFLIRETITTILEYPNGTGKRKKEPSGYDYNKINLSPFVSAGLEYRLRDDLAVRAEPTFRFGILKIYDAPLSEYLWNAGLNIGFYYSLK